MLSKEELFKPRFKVIADYPFNRHFFVDETIMLGEVSKTSMVANRTAYVTQPELLEFASLVRTSRCFYEDDFEKFPHLFEKLEWWEERKIKDMPKYLKIIKIINGANHIGEIIKAVKGGYGGFHKEGYTENNGHASGFDNIILECFEPSTEEEYKHNLKVETIKHKKNKKC